MPSGYDKQALASILATLEAAGYDTAALRKRGAAAIPDRIVAASNARKAALAATEGLLAALDRGRAALRRRR